MDNFITNGRYHHQSYRNEVSGSWLSGEKNRALVQMNQFICTNERYCTPSGPVHMPIHRDRTRGYRNGIDKARDHQPQTLFVV